MKGFNASVFAFGQTGSIDFPSCLNREAFSRDIVGCGRNTFLTAMDLKCWESRVLISLRHSRTKIVVSEILKTSKNEGPNFSLVILGEIELLFGFHD